MADATTDLSALPIAHPTIRLASVLALVVFVPQFGLAVLIALSVGLLLQRAVLGRAMLMGALQSIWRLRWLLLAIAVLYLGFTPGAPLFPFCDLPSRPGAVEGARRVLVLVVILLAVQAVLQALGPRQLAAAITQLIGPLRLVLFPVERFAIRLAAALDAVQAVGERARTARDASNGGSPLQRAAQLIVDVEQAAADAAEQLAEVPRLPAPHIWAWLLPATIAGLAYTVAAWST